MKKKNNGIYILISTIIFCVFGYYTVNNILFHLKEKENVIGVVVDDKGIADGVEKIYDAFVSVNVIKNKSNQGVGSGFIFSKDGYIPLWVGVKVLSFGIMGELFQVLKSEDQAEIAGYYTNVDAPELGNYLSILSNYRNLCAHEDILYNHETQKGIDETSVHDILNIPKVDDEYIYGIHDIFALIIILKHLLTYSDFKMMMNEIDYEIDWLASKLSSIDVKKVLYRMGFPDNYKEIAYIE